LWLAVDKNIGESSGLLNVDIHSLGKKSAGSRRFEVVVQSSGEFSAVALPAVGVVGWSLNNGSMSPPRADCDCYWIGLSHGGRSDSSIRSFSFWIDLNITGINIEVYTQFLADKAQDEAVFKIRNVMPDWVNDNVWTTKWIRKTIV
jgi:hypothetical protein